MGVVLRVSRIVMRPPLAATNCRVSVAIPERCCRKLSAVRSADSSARACPTHLTDNAPGAHSSLVLAVNVAAVASIDLRERFHRHVEAGQRQRRFREEDAACAIVLSDDRVGGEVARADVLRERLPYEQR